MYYSLITNTNLSHQSDPWHWLTGSDDFIHKRVNRLPSCRVQQKIKIINFPNIFHLNCKSFRTFRWLEQLSSSICCRVMAQQNMADMQNNIFLRNEKILMEATKSFCSPIISAEKCILRRLFRASKFSQALLQESLELH